jgi:hypothetical protein
VKLVLLVLAVLAGTARAETAAPPPPTGGGSVLVPTGATWQVSSASAPRPTRRLAPVVLAGLDVAAGRRSDGLAIDGDDADAIAPPAWPLANRADAVETIAPIAPVAADRERIAVVWATTRFALGAEAGDLRVLDLHARYGDGIVVWINGVEVARRRIPAGARAMAMAAQLHGAEWETFHVPVVPGVLRLGDNVLAVEVRPSGRSLAPSLDLEIVGRPAAELVRGPVLAGVTGDAATVVFESDLATDAVAEWGPTEALGHRVVATEGRARRHAIALTGLPAAAPVYYRIVVGGAATPVRSFRTLPDRGQVVRIAAYGDVRSGHDVHAAIVAQIRAEDPDLVVATGDLVIRGTDEGAWQRFFAITGELLATVPFWSALGNHDVGRSGDGRLRFGDLLSVPTAPIPPPEWATWYAIDVGDLHLAFLDSNAYDEATQLDWLEHDLTRAERRGARAILAIVHDGPYSRGDHRGNQTAVERYVPVLVRHHVTLLLSGHDHLYQRGRMDGLDYIVTGGGGAGLYPIACGVSGRRPCAHEDGMAFAASAYHYLMLALYADFLEACPKRPDGTALEPCVRYPLASR